MDRTTIKYITVNISHKYRIKNMANLRRVYYSDAENIVYGSGCILRHVEDELKIGYFHKWVEQSKYNQKHCGDSRNNNIYALIEDDFAEMILIHYTCMKFETYYGNVLQ
jgi:hypothetical protein